MPEGKYACADNGTTAQAYFDRVSPAELRMAQRWTAVLFDRKKRTTEANDVNKGSW
jgi:hypothetical protein